MLQSIDKRIPFILTPAAKDYLWGGNRLNDDYGKQIPVKPLAETWECSTHPDGVSGTPFEKDLKGYLNENPECLGSHSLMLTNGVPELPILVKLIDANKDLSIQVHPDDEYALIHENDRGKTEMWYVLDAAPDASLAYGFNQDVTRKKITEEISRGTLTNLLNYVPVHKNDLFFITPGTVHAIGSGCLIAEIQESSNLTYRLYDYGRLGKDGLPRELHIDKATDVANLKSSSAPRQPMRVLKYKPGCASELLGRCKYFQVERILLNTEVQRELVSFQTGGNSFHTLLCVDGCGSISGDSFMMNFFKGDCIFIPANSISLKLHGKAQLLNISC